MSEGPWILAYYTWHYYLMLSVFLVVCVAGSFLTTWLATRRFTQKRHDRPRRGWLLVVVFLMLVGLSFAGGRWILAYTEEHERRIDKMERTFYMLDGMLDPDSERGKGLFTDAEIDSIKDQRAKLRAKSARPAPHLTLPDS